MTTSLSQFAKVVLENINKTPSITSYYLDQNEELTQRSDWTHAVLTNDVDAIQTSIEDPYADTAYINLTQELDTFVENTNHQRSCLSEETLSQAESETLLERLQERDDFNPVGALLKRSREVLLRHRLDRGINEHGEDTHTELYLQISVEAAYSRQVDRHPGLYVERIKAVTKALDIAGFDTISPESQRAIDELVGNGPSNWHEGVTLDIIWAGKPGDVDLWSTGGDPFAVKIAEPSVLLMDISAGSGHDVKIAPKVGSDGIERQIHGHNPVLNDAAYTGYGSWDNVAGLIISAYRSNVTRL